VFVLVLSLSFDPIQFFQYLLKTTLFNMSSFSLPIVAGATPTVTDDMPILQPAQVEQVAASYIDACESLKANNAIVKEKRAHTKQLSGPLLRSLRASNRNHIELPNGRIVHIRKFKKTKSVSLSWITSVLSRLKQSNAAYVQLPVEEIAQYMDACRQAELTKMDERIEERKRGKNAALLISS
jgi:hypothetical protein